MRFSVFSVQSVQFGLYCSEEEFFICSGGWWNDRPKRGRFDRDNGGDRRNEYVLVLFLFKFVWVDRPLCFCLVLNGIAIFRNAGEGGEEDLAVAGGVVTGLRGSEFYDYFVVSN